ncbi:MAG: nucleoside transporter C-terminal domain-containing protein [Pseudomonadota bacterium]
MSVLQLQSLLGLVLLPLAAYALRERDRPLAPKTALRLALGGLGLQLAIAGLLLLIPPARAAVASIAGVVDTLQQATAEGTRLVFGYLGGGPAPFDPVAPQNGFILAFQALPLILFISALTALLYHWGILQRIVRAFAFALSRTLGVSGPLATSAAANVFVGMVEAPVLIRPYLRTLDRGGLFAVMSVGLATIAGTVLVLYASLMGATLPDAAGHLVIASVISAPAALMLAGLMVPTGETQALPQPQSEDTAAGPIDAIVAGTRAGVELLLGVVATLLVFVALVALVNALLAAIAGPFGLTLTLEGIAGALFAPLIWLIGVPWEEAAAGGALMGLKTVTNEFVAFLRLGADETLSERSRLIMAYALAGFANFGSVGIMIGGLTAMVPERRTEIVGLGLKSLVAGTLATLMTGAVIGLLTPPAA